MGVLTKTPRPAPNTFISPPLGLDNQTSYYHDSPSEPKQKNIVFRVLDILKGVRPGSDLTAFQVPPQFNLPKSQLQCYSEQIYCCAQDLLGQCADGVTALDRFLAVVRWHISNTRPAPFAKAPYNPILGETHHVTVGDLNLLMEQVSHHPPISALYATNPQKKLEILQWSKPQPKFSGTSVEVTIAGRKTLTLTERGETYEMTLPKLSFRFLPHAASEWVGETMVRCIQTGLEAVVCFKSRSLLGARTGKNRISGKITRSPSKQTLYSLSGCWDETVTLEDKEFGKKTVLYDARTVLSNLKNVAVKDHEAVSPMESVVVWSKLTQAVWNQDWDSARAAKTSVEERQRELRKQRSKAGETWKPKYFTETAHGNWEWALKGQPVPQGPIG